MEPRQITVSFTVTADVAAGLKRFAEKITHEKASAVLYPHVPKAVRADQAQAILSAFMTIDEALDDAGVRSWPWIESGQP